VKARLGHGVGEKFVWHSLPPVARGCGPVPLEWATAQRGHLRGVVGLTPWRPCALGGGPGEDRAKSDLRRWARRLATPQMVSKGSWIRGLAGQEATAVMSATWRQRQLRRAAHPTAHSSALASPDRRPLSAAVGWWWCARVAASGGRVGTRPAPGRVVGAPFAVLKAALWPAVAALCRSVGL
jgi:hypothetical protein